MRTTLTIDQDVFSAARDMASRDGLTIGQVISDLARQALTGTDRQANQEESFFGFQPLPSRGVVVTNDMVTAIREAEGI